MTVERWTIADRDEWLRRRRGNINGSEVGALFGVNPYLTPYALYVDKAGKADLAGPDTEVLRRGRILEPAVAEAVKEQRPKWQIEKADEYLWSPQWRIGCTPDFWVNCPERGWGVLQAKTVAKPRFDEDWQHEVPQWILLQALQEMMLAGVSWGAIGVLIVSSYTVECHIEEFQRHPSAEARIIETAREFWSAVDAGKEPKMDFARDFDVIRGVYPRDNGTVIDLSRDNRIGELLERHEQLSAMARHSAKEIEAVKAEIAAKIGDASEAIVPGWEKVTYKAQTRKAYEVKQSTFRVLRTKRTAMEACAA